MPLAALALGLVQLLPMGGDALTALAERLFSPDTARLLTFLLEAGDPVAVISLSAVTALWAASRGTLSVLRGLNDAYGLRESRGFLALRMACLGDTLGILLAVLGAAVLLFSLPFRITGPAVLQDFLQFFVLLLFLCLLHRTLPNHRTKVLRLLPGAAFSALSLLVFSRVYGWYLSAFSGPGRLYGNLSAVAATLLWLYICMELVLLGGFLNRLLLGGTPE